MRILKKYIRKIYHLIWFLSLFLIFSLNVFAREIGSFTLAKSGTLTSDYLTLYQGSGNFANWGLGTLIYTFGYTTTNTGSLNLPILTSAYADSGGNSYVCDFGSIAITSPSISTNATTGISYTIACPMVMGSNGLTNLGLIFSNQFSSAYVFNYSTSYSVEFISEDTFSSSDIVNAIAQNAYYTQQVIINESNDLSTILNNLNQNIQNTINNQNQNTQDIINSSGSNTQSIIDSSASNTQSQIESQKVCKETTINGSSILDKNKYLNSSGNLVNSSSGNGVTDFISLTGVTDLKYATYGNNYERLCFYNNSKSLVSCVDYSSISVGSSISIPSNASFVKFTINESTGKPVFVLSSCMNGNQAIDDSLNNINDTLNDSSVDSSDTTFNSLNSQLPTNTVISDLLLLPVRLLQAIVNSLGGTCSSFNLGSLYGTNLIMPCIDIESYLGSTIWIFIDLVFSGMFILVIRKKFIQIWENITNLKGGANEVD